MYIHVYKHKYYTHIIYTHLQGRAGPSGMYSGRTCVVYSENRAASVLLDDDSGSIRVPYASPLKLSRQAEAHFRLAKHVMSKQKRNHRAFYVTPATLPGEFAYGKPTRKATGCNTSHATRLLQAQLDPARSLKWFNLRRAKGSRAQKGVPAKGPLPPSQDQWNFPKISRAEVLPKTVQHRCGLAEPGATWNVEDLLDK